MMKKVNFVMVNELPAEVLETVSKVVETYQETRDFGLVQSILKFIGGGVCGKVFDLGEYVIKINHFSHSRMTLDGKILHDLQGVPFIPKLYMYSEDNRFIVMQKIKGQTVSQYNCDPEFAPKSKWNQELHEQMCEQMFHMCLERGWKPCDCHGSNCMFDEDGKFWVVDVGLFLKADSMRDGDLEDLKYNGKTVSQSIQKHKRLMTEEAMTRVFF